MGEKTPTILIADDEVNLCQVLSAILGREGYEVITVNDALQCIETMKEIDIDVLISDLVMPNMDGIELLRKVREINPSTSVIMMTAYGTVKTAVEAMKLGAFDYISKPFDNEEMKVIVQKAIEQRRLINENIYLRQQLKARYRLENIIGDSSPMQEVYKMVEKVANSKATVLLRGESGTGKELVARAIHFNSRRRDGPFVPVCCAALPGELLESELFGHEKGAFTGAQYRKPGRFELANGGTIFLDEIGELSLSLQVKLLRVLQEREFERVGGTKSIKVDVRVIAASNRDLEAALAKGNFREDLYYRLKVVQIFLPPLRERKEDIPLLIEHFVKKYSSENEKKIKYISRRALALLLEYDWPGNVRELENAIERAIVMADEDETTITTDLLPSYIQSVGKLDEKKETTSIAESAIGEAVAEVEKKLLLQALQETGWNLTRTARKLGLSLRSVRYRMRKYDLYRERAMLLTAPAVKASGGDR